MCVCLYYVLVCRRIHNGVLPSFVFFSLSFFFYYYFVCCIRVCLGYFFLFLSLSVSSYIFLLSETERMIVATRSNLSIRRCNLHIPERKAFHKFLFLSFVTVSFVLFLLLFFRIETKPFLVTATYDLLSLQSHITRLWSITKSKHSSLVDPAPSSTHLHSAGRL